MPNSATADLLIVTLLPSILYCQFSSSVLPFERIFLSFAPSTMLSVTTRSAYPPDEVFASKSIVDGCTSFTGAVSTTLNEQVKDEP